MFLVDAHIQIINSGGNHMKITGATKVEDIRAYLVDNLENLGKVNADLLTEVVEFHKRKKASKKEYVELANRVEKALETKPAENKSVASVKPKGGKNASKKEEAVKEEAVKESANESVRKVQEQELVLAKVFPTEVVVEGDTYKIAKDINSMSDLKKAFDKGSEIVIAMLWTKRHLKQFPYGIPELHSDVSEFPNDLDLAQAIYMSDDLKVMYAVSVYTDNCSTFLSKDIPQYEGLRFSNGMEFQIYIK